MFWGIIQAKRGKMEFLAAEWYQRIQRYTKNPTQRTAGSRMILKDAFQIKSPVRTKPTHSFALCLNLFLRYIFFFSFPKTGSPLEQMESYAWASPVWAHAAWGPSFAASESTCCTDHTPV